MDGIPGYLEVKDAATLIGRSYSQVCRYIESGLLPARQVGNVRLVRVSDAKRFKPPRRGNPNFYKPTK